MQDMLVHLLKCVIVFYTMFMICFAGAIIFSMMFMICFAGAIIFSMMFMICLAIQLNIEHFLFLINIDGEVAR